jgi:hypothetical protein
MLTDDKLLLGALIIGSIALLVLGVLNVSGVLTWGKADKPGDDNSLSLQILLLLFGSVGALVSIGWGRKLWKDEMAKAQYIVV